jgi:hypothetical protein
MGEWEENHIKRSKVNAGENDTKIKYKKYKVM